jgi:hypothetical protein
MTPSEKLLRAAATAAAHGPARHGRYQLTAGIPWDALDDLRDALDELGIDWRAARRGTSLPPVADEANRRVRAAQLADREARRPRALS